MAATKKPEYRVDPRELFELATEIALGEVERNLITHPEDLAAALISTVEVLAAAETIRWRRARGV